MPDGPGRKPGAPLDWRAIPKLLVDPPFRSALLGYLGHMWELYTFWALVPAWLALTSVSQISLWSFAIVGIGGLGCVIGGWLSERFSSAIVAKGALGISGLCCVLAPWLLGTVAALPLMLIWGLTVVADSPQLSALTARSAPPAMLGTGLALATSMGFGLTIISLQAVSWVELVYAPWVLAIGPVLGLLALSMDGPSERSGQSQATP